VLKKLANQKRIFICTILILVTYFGTTIFLTPYYNAVEAVTYSWGSRGGVVTEIQTRLRRWGYLRGNVDGIFGYQTYTAVRLFQQRNGLKVDGIVGRQTLASLGINVGAAGGTPTGGGAAAGTPTGGGTGGATTNQEVNLLARIINGEARGEPYEGQVAVGAVVLNRVRDPRFPNTIAGVIYEPGAFTAIVDGQFQAEMVQSSFNAARDALNGWDPSGGAVFYFNPAKTTNQWIYSRPLIKVIGKHRFCS
jgi:N-acetylmuramoyl-L-alanine amidase